MSHNHCGNERLANCFYNQNVINHSRSWYLTIVLLLIGSVLCCVFFERTQILYPILYTHVLKLLFNSIYSPRRNITCKVVCSCSHVLWRPVYTRRSSTCEIVFANIHVLLRRVYSVLSRRSNTREFIRGNSHVLLRRVYIMTSFLVGRSKQNSVVLYCFLLISWHRKLFLL